MSSDIYNLSAVELIKLYANKKLSPVEATKNIIQRVKTIDKKINSYVFIDEQNAIEEEKEMIYTKTRRNFNKINPLKL